MKHDDKDSLRRLRNSPEVERGLKQFQKYANMGDNTAEYKARYEYAFHLSDDKRSTIDSLMAQGMSFMEAFDAATSRTP